MTIPAPPRPVPTAGVLRLRPRYGECDPMGVVHHASYLPWLEMGRTELLRDAGVSYAQLEEQGVFLVIVKVDARYRRPARYDDLLELRTRVVGGSRVKIEHEYEIDLIERATGSGADPTPPAGQNILGARTVLACVDRAGRPRALPEWVLAGPGNGRARDRHERGAGASPGG